MDSAARTAETPRLNNGEMLAEELAHVRGIAKPEPYAAYDAALGCELSALCLSGGGIRSASFCLGVLQALADKGLLRRFDYLSTVNGGGLIGGWLQQMLRDEAHPSAAATVTAVDRVARVEQLLRVRAPALLDRLRASVSSWAGAAPDPHNVVLTWLIFLPVFLLAALAPIFYRTLIWWAGTSMAPSNAWRMGFLTTAMLVLGYGTYRSCRLFPGPHSTDRRGGRGNREKYLRSAPRIVLPALAWAMLLPISLYGIFVSFDSRPAYRSESPLFISVVYFIVLAAAYEIAARWPTSDYHSKLLFRVSRVHWLIAAVGSAAILALLLHLLLSASAWLIRFGLTADVLAIGAPMALLGVLLAQSTFYLGLRAESLYGALDREWRARMNGIMLVIGTGWMLVAASCLITSRFVTLPDGIPQPFSIVCAALGTLAVGLTSSWLGKKTIAQMQEILDATGDLASAPPLSWLGKPLQSLAKDPNKTEKLVAVIQVVLPFAFVVALFALLAALLQLSLGIARLELLPVIDLPPFGVFSVDGAPIALQIILGLILVSLIIAIGRSVNINRFSMHARYRNRLIRTFLSTPLQALYPDPDSEGHDDPRLRSFRAGEGGQILFPVINMAINIRDDNGNARAERKNASFTATPLHCGSPKLRREENPAGADAEGLYVRTSDFAGKEGDWDERATAEGVHLSDMLTVSGVGANPNWGYHSSPQVAFLMTLFNVRLGAWYPNPLHATDAELRVAKPRNSLLMSLDELLGRPTHLAQGVYLSDGGQFENLGVYEMLRRRCRRIVVVDVSEDGDCSFFDLGRMIRRAEIELSVKIHLATPHIASREAIEKGFEGPLSGFAHGVISYLADDGYTIGQGEIIYIKPCLLPEVPPAIRAFAASSKKFPHESTGDSRISENQFESYRALGHFQGEKLTSLMPNFVDGEGGEDGLQLLFDVTRHYANPSKDPVMLTDWVR